MDKQDSIAKMFDSIAKYYDFLNRLLSLRLDIYWRNNLVKQLSNKPLLVLDIATGTGDVIFSMIKQKNITKAIGIDISLGMLNIAQKKALALADNQSVEFLPGNASNLSFNDESFDTVTIAFGIRNVIKQQEALKECYRVLKQDGHLLILEFCLPKNMLIKSIYLTYFRHILPFIAGLISKKKNAYEYLNSSVEEFVKKDALINQITQAGFNKVEVIYQTFGVAAIYKAQKL